MSSAAGRGFRQRLAQWFLTGEELLPREELHEFGGRIAIL